VDDGAEVFRALADPTRRSLLDALFATDGQTVVALCTLFPEMTRFGVMKHLKVLEEANLVTSRRAGRTKQHFLNPVPIAQIAHRWIDKYAAPYASALVELERQVGRATPPHEG
jgi:DNA-binding transcriptional ArsR family regulator